MRTQILKPTASAVIGLVLSSPAAYFFLVNILNDMGLPGLYSAFEPLFRSMGSNEGLGFNLNLLIAFGPLIALLLNVNSVLSLNWASSKTDIKLDIQIEKRWSNWMIISLAGLCLLVLFFYLIGENCK